MHRTIPALAHVRGLTRGLQTDIAYATARFSLARPNVKTHIHLSTGFMAWFLPHGSTIYERYRQEIGLLNESITETHANTYLHAGSLAEAVVNALLAPQAGQALHGKAARIFRLATLGPVAEFPNAGWGSGHPSSPVSAAVAAEPFDYEDLNLWMPEGAALDGK